MCGVSASDPTGLLFVPTLGPIKLCAVLSRVEYEIPVDSDRNDQVSYNDSLVLGDSNSNQSGSKCPHLM